MTRHLIFTGIIALVLLSKAASASSVSFSLRYETKSSLPAVEQTASVDDETWSDSDAYLNYYYNGYGCFPPAYSEPRVAAPWIVPASLAVPQPITRPVAPPVMRLYHRRGMIIAVPDPSFRQYDFLPYPNYQTVGVIIYRPVVPYAYINPYLYPYPYPYPFAPR